MLYTVGTHCLQFFSLSISMKRRRKKERERETRMRKKQVPNAIPKRVAWSLAFLLSDSFHHALPFVRILTRPILNGNSEPVLITAKLLNKSYECTAPTGSALRSAMFFRSLLSVHFAVCSPGDGNGMKQTESIICSLPSNRFCAHSHLV